MMIKEVAEEVGATFDRAPRGGQQVAHPARRLRAAVLLLGSRRGRKVDSAAAAQAPGQEDDRRFRYAPLTDEQITAMLQASGIQVTRRTVAKYREDMKIPSTHQRRTRN
jgi:RNA polymerase sigma-54 factor